jgi:hypothetical protein
LSFLVGDLGTDLRAATTAAAERRSGLTDRAPSLIRGRTFIWQRRRRKQPLEPLAGQQLSPVSPPAAVDGAIAPAVRWDDAAAFARRRRI